MSALKEFQERHGAAWASITASETFQAALALANLEKVQGLPTLSAAEIEQSGKLILADLVGHMKFENALIGLHEKKEFVFQELGPETYPSPIAEAAVEAGAERGEATDEEVPSFARPSTSVAIPGGRRITYRGPKLQPAKKSAPKGKKKK